MRRRSVTERPSLYFHTPVISGPPSYGGVQKAIYIAALRTFGASFFFSIFLWFFFAPVSVFLVPIGLTMFVFMSLVALTRRGRRDWITVMIEARRLEKEESRDV